MPSSMNTSVSMNDLKKLGKSNADSRLILAE